MMSERRSNGQMRHAVGFSFGTWFSHSTAAVHDLTNPIPANFVFIENKSCGEVTRGVGTRALC
jgi:hypothetical protein